MNKPHKRTPTTGCWGRPTQVKLHAYDSDDARMKCKLDERVSLAGVMNAI